MIRSFRNKQLRSLWETGKTKIGAQYRARILRRLDVLEVAASVGDMNLPGFDFHPLQGHDPTRYSVHVNGPWCITFRFEEGDAYDLDFEQYH
jgi:proteic killer suppression protein